VSFLDEMLKLQKVLVGNKTHLRLKRLCTVSAGNPFFAVSLVKLYNYIFTATCQPTAAHNILQSQPFKNHDYNMYDMQALGYSICLG
jgi:hypothetical protein